MLSNMSGDSVEVMLARIEGKLDRLGDADKRSADDILILRKAVHENAQNVQPVVLLDLPIKFPALVARMDECEREREQRKGAVALAKAMWAVAGVLSGAVVALVARALGV